MKILHDIVVEDNGSIEEIIWAPDGGSFAVVNFPPPPGSMEGMGPTGFVQIYDAASWQIRQTLPTTITRPRIRVAWSADSQQLATVSADAVTIWQVSTGQVVRKLRPAHGEIFSVAWSTDGLHLAASLIDPEDLKIIVWELPGGSVWRTRSLGTKTGGISWMTWSPSDNRLASITLTQIGPGQFSRQIIIWDADTDMMLHSLPFPPGTFEGLGQSHGWSPDGASLSVATGIGQDDRTGTTSDECRLTIWDTMTGQVRSTITLCSRSLIGAAWSPNGTRLASSTSEEMMIFDVESGILLERLPSLFPQEPPEEEKQQVGEVVVFMTTLGFTRSFAWSPDGWILVAGNVGGIRAWVIDGK